MGLESIENWTEFLTDFTSEWKSGQKGPCDSVRHLLPFGNDKNTTTFHRRWVENRGLDLLINPRKRVQRRRSIYPEIREVVNHSRIHVHATTNYSVQFTIPTVSVRISELSPDSGYKIRGVDVLTWCRSSASISTSAYYLFSVLFTPCLSPHNLPLRTILFVSFSSHSSQSSPTPLPSTLDLPY